MDAANAVPVIGTPLAYGLGFAVLLLVVLIRPWSDLLYVVAHEGGHIVMGLLTFRGPRGFTVDENAGGSTPLDRYHWSVSDLLTRFVGYPAPCVLGLGGAALIRAGYPASVLWISLLLLVAAFFQALELPAIVTTALFVLAVGWVAFAGSTAVQAGTAVVVVWWLLIGGALDSTIWLSRAKQSDAGVLATRTWIPPIVWHAIWAVIGIVCLWKGGRALLAVTTRG